MKIYVAGNNLERARTVMDKLIEGGHEITYDWVSVIEDKSDMLKKSLDERKAVQDSDILVYLWAPDQESARYEAGMAMGLNKKIILSGYPKDKLSFFTSLPEVVHVDSDDSIYDVI